MEGVSPWVINLDISALLIPLSVQALHREAHEQNGNAATEWIEERGIIADGGESEREREIEGVGYSGNEGFYDTHWDSHCSMHILPVEKGTET